LRGIGFCLGSISRRLFFGSLLFCSSLFSRELLGFSLFLGGLRLCGRLGVGFVLSDLIANQRLNFSGRVGIDT
jgi:hypothetical protein